MADDDSKQSASEDGTHEDVEASQQLVKPPPSPPLLDERTVLLDRARAFLVSPQIRHEETSAKRRFLSEKGLVVEEIETLLRELVSDSAYDVYRRRLMTAY